MLFRGYALIIRTLSSDLTEGASEQGCIDGVIMSMENRDVEKLIESGLPGCKVTVSGDGRHFEAVVISEEFVGKTPLQRQRMVMKTVRAKIDSDELHALSIKTLTPD